MFSVQAEDTSKSQGRGQCEDPCRRADKEANPKSIQIDLEIQSPLLHRVHDGDTKSHIKTNKKQTLDT